MVVVEARDEIQRNIFHHMADSKFQAAIFCTGDGVSLFLWVDGLLLQKRGIIISRAVENWLERWHYMS